MVDSTVGVSFADCVHRVLCREVRPEHPAGQNLLVEMLPPESDNSPAATVPPETDSSTALQVRVGRNQNQYVLQDLVR